MRRSIATQVLQWGSQGNWIEDERAERVFEKLAEAPELFVNPDPDTCGSYTEEASRIYANIKDEYSLRTVDEAYGEWRDYDDQRKRAAGRMLWDRKELIEQGEQRQLVEDLEQEYGPEFVANALDLEVGEVWDVLAAGEAEAEADQEHERMESAQEDIKPETETETEAAETATVETEPETEIETTVDDEPDATLDPDDRPDHWPIHGTAPDLDAYYWKLRNYVRMVTIGAVDSLLIEAGPGIGKSFQITRTLRKELGVDGYKKVGGYCSPLELYHLLFEVSEGRTLFMDDIEGVLSDKRCLSLLKQATWSENGERYVEWKSTTEKLEVPDGFVFNGRIIMCCNETPDDILFESLRDRCLVYNISFGYDERIDMMREIAKVDYDGLTWDERQETVDWIETRTGPGDEVNLRTMFHCFVIRKCNDRWEEMAIDQLGIVEEVALLRQCIAEADTVEEARVRWCEETGGSRATFFRKKKEIALDDATTEATIEVAA